MADITELTLKLSLKRIVLLSIAEILWKSQNVAESITVYKKTFLAQQESCIGSFPPRYKDWEKIISKVLNTSNVLGLPSQVTADLQRIIVLIGEKIFFFHAYIRASNCSFCRSVNGSAFCYFSSNGVLKTSCSLLHRKYSPSNDDDNDKDRTVNRLLWLMACIRCGDMKLISKIKEEAIDFLKYQQPELNLRDKKNILLNIIIVYEYTFYRTVSFSNRPIPDHYLKNTDYIIPLKVALEKFGIGFGDFGKVNYYKLLNSQNLLADILPELDMFSNLETELFKICEKAFPCVFRFEDLQVADFLYAIKFLPSHHLLDFLKKNIRQIVVGFLPIWPYQELIPKMLDLLFKEKVDLDYEFLLEFITLNIGWQNKQVYRVKKPLYLRLFNQVWCRASYQVKVFFLVNRVKILVSKKMKTPIVLSNKDLKKCGDDLNRIITDRCGLLVTRQGDFVEDFIKKIVIFDEEFVKFRERHRFMYDKYALLSPYYYTN